MKKLIFLILLTISVGLNAQTVKSAFGGYGNVATVTGSGPTFTITVNSFTGSPRFQSLGTWIGSDVSAGDVIWVECSRFVIQSVVSSTFTSMVVNTEVPADDWALGVSAPFGGARCAVVHEDIGNLPVLPPPADGNAGALSGVDGNLYACMVNHYNQSLLTTANNLNEIAFTTGLTVPASSVATDLGYKLAKNNSGDGNLYQWDGAVWQIVGGSGVTDIAVATSPSNVTVSSSTGLDGLIPSATQTQAGVLSAVDKTKIDSTVDTYTDSPTLDFTKTGTDLTSIVKPASLDSTHIKVGGIELEGLSQDGAVTGQVLGYNGTNWIPTTSLTTVNTEARLVGDGSIASPLDIAPRLETTGVTVDFETRKVFGSETAPVSGNVNFINTNANVDEQYMIHRHTTAPSFPATSSISGTYQTGFLNYIKITRINPTLFIININE